MDKLSSSFGIFGVIDGTTINGYVRVDNTPLVQRYVKGTDNFIPNFESMAENIRPVVVAILRDASTGDVVTPNSIKFMYNGLELTFDPGSNLSTNEGMEGMFKKLVDYQAAVGSQSYSLPALRVMKNLVPISGYDNDRIGVSGTVEVGGQSIPFNELSKAVIIQESNEGQYDVIISNDKGFAITEAGETLTLQADIYAGGNKVSDLSGYSFKWFKLTGEGETALGTAQTQVISASDVDNKLVVRCDVYNSEESNKVSGFAEISDFSDPYMVRMDITGIDGTAIRKGQTATITPKAVKRSTGEEAAGLVSSWTFRIQDNEGVDFTLTGKDGASFSGTNCQISYEDIVRAKMGISGYVTADIG